MSQNSAAPSFTVNLELARKVLNTIDAGLCSGTGKPVPGQMCVEAAVCFAMGLPHGDRPVCVSKAVRSFKIKLNDKSWSSNTARAKGLRRIGVAQLGSSGVIDDRQFSTKLAEKTIRTIVPLAMRALLAISRLALHHAAIKIAADNCESHGTRQSAIEAQDVARTVHAAAAAYAAATADAYAAYAAAAAAAYAAATADADAATDAATYAADADAATDAAKRDRILTISAELAIDVLRELNCPGIEYMDILCPLEGGK